MAHISKAVSINCDATKAIDYIADVNHHPAFIPPLKTISNISGDPKQVGTKWNWTFTMVGVEFEGPSETTQFEASKVFGYKSSGGITSDFTYAVEPEGDGIKLSIDVEYEVPEGAIAKIADQAVIERQNNDSADQAANNLKIILEG